MARRGRRKVYQGEVVTALEQIWEICGRICSKRLQPFLPEIVAVLERQGWSIVTEVEVLADKAVVMKATVRDMLGNIIATARKKETEIGFPDYIEKAETGAVGRALVLCGYGTLHGP